MRIADPKKMKMADSGIQIVCPDSLAEYVIREKHTCTGHGGVAKAMMSIYRKFYVYQLAAKLRHFINTCGLCLKLKKSPTIDKLPMTISAGKRAHRPFSFLQIDYKSLDLRGVPSKHSKVLVVCCEFTGFVFFKLTKGETSEEAAKYLLRLTKRLGNFTSISSDRGSAFSSYLIEHVSKALGIEWPQDSTHQPQSTGYVERRVAMCSELLRYSLLKYPKMDIKDVLPDVQGAVNRVESTTMGCSAFYAMHGWESVDNVETECGMDKSLTNNNKRLIEEVVDSNNLRMELVKKARYLASKEVKHRHNLGIVNIPDFKVGDLCLLQTHDHKLSSQTSRKNKCH